LRNASRRAASQIGCRFAYLDLCSHLRKTPRHRLSFVGRRAEHDFDRRDSFALFDQRPFDGGSTFTAQRYRGHS
jgi:hypothetical protein